MLKLIKTTSYLIATLLLLSCLSSYADEEQIATYYTFVMYKAPNDSQWELPSNPTAIPGSYRFQIVYMNPHEENNLQWIALRGEFEVKQFKNGIKFKRIYTLDKTSKKEELLYNKILKWMKPLYKEQKKLTIYGTYIPNFIRFLIRQTNEVKYTWNDNKNKQYHIYRLHYLNDQLSQEKQIEIISRFLNPKQPPTTDINELKEWINDNKDFKLAEYLGEPDERHINFYKNFKTWFNNRYYYNHINKPNLKNMSEEENDSNWVSILLAILFVLIVIISIIFYFKDKLKGFLLKPKKNYVSKSEFDNLKKELLQINNQLIKLSPRDIEYNELSQLLETEVKNFLNKNLGNYLNLHLKSYIKNQSPTQTSEKSFELLKKELQEQINNKLVKLTPPEIDYNKLSQLVETEVKTNLDKNFGNYFHLLKKELQPQINNEVAKQIPSEIDYNKLSQLIETEVKKVLEPNFNKKLKTQPEPVKNEEKPEPPPKPTDNTITQIKTRLLDNNLVNDEAALNNLDTNVEACTFVINLVGNCLKFNQPLSYYQNINDTIQKITNNKISLLIPNIGDDISAEEHNIMGQQIVNKGKLNVVGVFIRPGVKCDDVIKHKAEVIQNV